MSKATQEALLEVARYATSAAVSAVLTYLVYLVPTWELSPEMAGIIMSVLTMLIRFSDKYKFVASDKTKGLFPY